MKMPATVAAVALIVLGWAAAMPAQNPPGPNAALAPQLTKARRANATLMRQYTWYSRVEIVEKGTVQDLRLELVNYGPGGSLQSTTVNDQSAPLPFGFIRRKLAERDRAKIEQYLMELRSLIEQYTLPSEGRILDFMNEAVISGPDGSGLLQMTGQNVLYPGDALTVWIDARTHQTRRVQATTIFQGDQVDLTATFKTLKSGLTYMAFGEVIVPAKELSVQLQNYDYNRNN